MCVLFHKIMRWPHTVLNTQNSLFFYVYPLNFFCKCSFHVWGGGFLQPPYTIKSSGRVQQFCSGIQKLLRTLFWQERSNLSVRLCRSEISMFILQGGNIILGTVRLVKAWLPLFFFLPPPSCCISAFLPSAHNPQGRCSKLRARPAKLESWST